MIRLLGIETSSEACSVAVSEGDQVLCRHQQQPRGHAELILPAIRGLLDEAGFGLKDLDAIAFGRGPGSFTSLRIGIGVVQGLAWGAGLGVVPVSSLAVLAQGAVARENIQPGSTIVTAVDARMDEVFHATFLVNAAGGVDVQGSECVDLPTAIRLPHTGSLIGVGNGFDRYPALARMGVDWSSVHADAGPSSREVIALARDWLEGNPALPAHEAQPVYVRNRVAEKPAREG